MARTASIDLLQQKRNRALNTLHTWLLGFGSLALLAVTAWAFGGGTGILYALIFGGVSMFAVRRISPRMVLTMYKARPVGAAEFPAGLQLIEELSRRAGLPRPPALFVIPSRLMNAFAVGGRDDSAIAVTDALARNMSLRELAGVLAHEISHVAHGDMKVMAFADMVSRFTSLMSTVGILSLLLNLGSFIGGGGEQVPWLAVIVLIAAPTVGGLLQMALSRTREFDADLGAAMLTEDPDGLASALIKLERAQRRRWESLFLPGGRIPDPSMLRTHPQTEERVRRLLALKSAVEQGAMEIVEKEHPRRSEPRVSIVPRIPHSQPRQEFRGPWGASLLAAFPEVAGGEDGPACDRHLHPPEDGPRLRPLRGGVYW